MSKILMSSSLNIQLTNELRRFVDERAHDDDVYSTPSEYIRDLIRHDMEYRNKKREREIAAMLMDARNTAITPLDDGFIQNEKALLKQRSESRKRKA